MSDYTNLPTKSFSARELFGIDSDMKVKGFAEADRARAAGRSGLPLRPPHHARDSRRLRSSTAASWSRAITAPANRRTSSRSRRASTGRWSASTSTRTSRRIDLVGKDAIVLKDGKQITEFRDGILPWAVQNNVALVFDEYDAGRPDVMFVIQRVLESPGRLTLLDQNRVITPHPAFRLFSTTNTIGLGDTSGLYHGTQQINQGQMDRWIDRRDAQLSARTRRKRASFSPRPRATRPRRARSSSPTWCGSPISRARPSSTATSRP